jgi:hypothetical protein
MRTALFWVITQQVVVIYYRRFGTTIGPIFKGQESFLDFHFFGFFTLEYGTNGLSRNVGKKLPLLAA